MSKYVRKKHRKNCVVCDEVFYASNRGKNTRRYCSSVCRYAKHKMHFNCETCEAEVIRTKGNLKNRVYCSKECSDIGKIGVSVNKVEEVELTCLNCNKSFQVLPHARGRKFCTRQCADENKVVSAPKMTLRSLWEKRRIEALARDYSKCRRCEMGDEEHKSVYGRGLNVHHIIPHHYYKEDNPEQHSLKNLETLCTPCHRRVHKEELNPMKYDREKFRSI